MKKLFILKKLIVSYFVPLYLCAFLSGCGDKIEPGNTKIGAKKTVKTHVAEATITQQPFFYEAVGTITARTSSVISSKLMGTVQAVNVKEGDEVKEGDLLAVIDQRQVSAELDKAQAALAESRRAEASSVSATESAKASAELAKSTYDRYMKLIKEESVSRQEFEETEAKLRQARATLAQTKSMLDASRERVRQAEAAVAGASAGKQDAMIRAPYAGKIIEKTVDIGNMASPGIPLFIIEKEDLFCADIIVPERYIQSVSLGLELKAVIPAMNALTVTGKVGRIIPVADAATRSFQVKVAMPENIVLKSGMFVRVSIPVGGAGMILIPLTAVVSRGQLTGIYLIDNEQIARFRLVRTGKTYDEAVEILSGIKEKDRYVVNPPRDMEDGVKIEEMS